MTMVARKNRFEKKTKISGQYDAYWSEKKPKVFDT
jgi:hypothetical protein